MDGISLEKISNDSSWPRISIVIPSYNQGGFIEESIRSVLLQQYPNLEFFIMDGGSTDDTIEIIKKYSRWIDYWESVPDKGQSHAINKGLRLATGTFFNWHNSDDILLPGILFELSNAFQNHKDASYVHGYLEVIDEQSKVKKGTYVGRLAQGKGYFPTIEDAVCHLRSGRQPGCLMDRRLIREAGLIDEKLDYVMDFDILIRLGLLAKPFYIDKAVARVRIHDKCKTFAPRPRHAEECLILARKIFQNKHAAYEVRHQKSRCFEKAHKKAAFYYNQAGMPILSRWHNFLGKYYSLIAKFQ
mgnify:CR=1 FL=1